MNNITDDSKNWFLEIVEPLDYRKDKLNELPGTGSRLIPSQVACDNWTIVNFPRDKAGYTSGTMFAGNTETNDWTVTLLLVITRLQSNWSTPSRIAT